MYMLTTGGIKGSRARVLSALGWALWAIFIGVWIASLVPFYARSLHLVSDASLQYAGLHYERFQIEYAPEAVEVYGASFLATGSKSVVCMGPLVFIFVLIVVLWRASVSWHSYSRLGIFLRLAAAAVTLTLAVLSYDLAGKFLVWGLG